MGYDIVIRCDTIRDDTIRLDTIRCVKRCDKEVEWTNCFDILFDKEDVLVDDNGNFYWSEERVWWNVVKDIEASEENSFFKKT